LQILQKFPLYWKLINGVFPCDSDQLSDEISKREIRSLTSINDNHPKTILSLDRIMTEPGNGIRHVNLIDWLLNV